MLTVVCDTNIPVSGFLFNGNERRLLELIAEGKVKLFLSDEIIAEFSRVMRYPRLSSRDMLAIQK